jgi:hypothetical protein
MREEETMKLGYRFGTAVLATTALLAAGATAANAATTDHSRDGVGTVFVQTDGVAGNAIAAYDRLGDGTLRAAGVYATGGNGLALTGSVVDHLASQSGLTRNGSDLFAVNAGSDTITSFAVVGDRLVRRQVVASRGEAPVSVTAHDHRVFVLNARGGGSIQGYLDVAGYLVAVPSWHRDLGLDPNATPEFTHTPAEIAFTPDGSKLVISTKGNTSAFDVFQAGFRLSATPVVTTLPGAVPFGFQFDAADHLVASEAATNSVATFRVEPDGQLTALAVAATGQAATCWIVVDGAYVYASNAGSGTLSGYRLGAGGTLTSIGQTSTDAGTVDAAVSADRRFLYVQTGAAGMVDEFRVAADGSLARIGSVLVPGAAGGEGIVAE